MADQVRLAGFSLTVAPCDQKLHRPACSDCYAAVAWVDDPVSIAAGYRFAEQCGVPLLGMIVLFQGSEEVALIDARSLKNSTVSELDGTLWSTMSASQVVWEVEQARQRLTRRKQLEQKLREAVQDLNNRKLIERAKGYLMDRFGLKETEAYRRLQEQAMKHRKSMKEIAEQVLLLSDITGGP